MPVPFFSDFQRQTKDFWKPDKYSFGRQVHLTTTEGDTKLTAKVDHGDDNVSTKLIAKVTPDWGTLEVTQASRKGIQIEAKVPKIWKDLDLTHKINYNYSMESNFKYRKQDNWWNIHVKNVYHPSKRVEINNEDRDQRVCETTIGVAVGDEDLNLSVGGEVVLQDHGDPGRFSSPNTSLTSYKLGFLYTPTKTSGYSLIYKPEVKAYISSLLYDFSLWRQCSERCTISARAQGKVSTTKGTNNQVPIISVGGCCKLNAGGNIKGYINSRRDWGAVYTTSITNSLTASFGISNLNDIQTTSYKFCFA